MLTYTNIQHDFRKANALSLNEYVLCDMIYHLSNNKNNKITGWCHSKRESLAEDMGLSKQTVIKLIQKLIDLDFIYRDYDTKYLQTTQKWDAVYTGEYSNSVNKVYQKQGKESLPSVNKVYPLGKESLPKLGKESLLYIDNNNIDNNKDKREENALDYFKNNFPSQYETFCMQYKSKIRDYQHFEKMFELKSEEEDLKYDQKVIKARLERFAINYIAVDEKQSRVIQIPIHNEVSLMHPSRKKID